MVSSGKIMAVIISWLILPKRSDALFLISLFPGPDRLIFNKLVLIELIAQQKVS